MPPLLRHIGNYATASWSSEHLLKDWRHLRESGLSQIETGQLILRMMREADRRDCHQFFGPSHPEVVH